MLDPFRLNPRLDPVVPVEVGVLQIGLDAEDFLMFERIDHLDLSGRKKPMEQIDHMREQEIRR